MSEPQKAMLHVQAETTGHATTFASLFGYTPDTKLQSQNENTPAESESERRRGGVLVAPEGSWAISLKILTPNEGRILLRVLHDLSPLSNPTDATLRLRISAYDEAASNSPPLEQEMRSGLTALDTLAHRIMNKGYNEITERSLRRPLLMQMAHHPLFERLGISHSVFTPEPANAG